MKIISSYKKILRQPPLTTVSVEALTDDAAQDQPIHKGPRISKRQKKPPAIKSDDFSR